ncbi:hypothetical protein V8F33_003969 [Rhypophila sp. PSN 637]
MEYRSTDVFIGHDASGSPSPSGARAGIAGYEAAALGRPSMAPANAARFMWHADRIWAEFTGWCKALVVCYQYVNRKVRRGGAVRALVVFFITFLPHRLKHMPHTEISVPISTRCFSRLLSPCLVLYGTARSHLLLDDCCESEAVHGFILLFYFPR